MQPFDDAAAGGSDEGKSEGALESLERRIRARMKAKARVKHAPASYFEASLERKQNTALKSTLPASPFRSAEQAAELDRRIDAKRSANNKVAFDSDEAKHESSNEEKEDDLQETTRGKDNNENHRDSNGTFNEQGRNASDLQEAEVNYPIVRTDSRIMEEIAQEGIQIDESGGIQAFVADPVAIDEAAVVGVIKSDEEVEREERKAYLSFFTKAVASIVLIIIVIGVPVTLKLTNVIGPVVVITSPPTDAPSSMPSQSPSAMPSSIEFTEVVERLLPISGETLLDVGSPQYKAANWIADEDPMQLDINDPGFEQRYAMAVFYYSLDGDNWNSKSGWLSGESECSWEHVEGPGCLDGCINEKVCAIRIEDGWLGSQKGTLPDELSILTEMRHFELQNRGKDITGTIPSGIGTSWAKLTAFMVSYNHLEGDFPFASNPLLGTIFLNGNEIEDDIGKITALESLSWFEAEDNNFTGTIPEALTELQYLWKVKLTDNKLSGAIPDTWTSALLLENLFLSGNQLTGDLPPTLASVPNLRKLELSRNMFSGSIPSLYYQMQNLQELHIDGNNLGGSLSQLEEPLYLGIRKFVINGNAFEGRFPVEQFEKTEILNTLTLHDNQLTGSITQTICQRLDESNKNTRLQELSADCDLIECSCCTCL